MDDFYPRPPRGGRRAVHQWTTGDAPISIHALREEGDNSAEAAANRAWQISIHALREEGDGCSTTTTPSQTYFYPRPPRGGRRRSRQLYSQRSKHFYPRPPRGGRQWLQHLPARHLYFYPRPPRGGRPNRMELELPYHQFLSTPSARRATKRSMHRVRR